MGGFNLATSCPTSGRDGRVYFREDGALPTGESMAGYWSLEESKGVSELKRSLDEGIRRAIPKDTPEGFLRFRLVVRPNGSLWVETVFQRGTVGRVALDFAEIVKSIARKFVPAGVWSVQAVVMFGDS